jgi:hypothetical protein
MCRTDVFCCYFWNHGMLSLGCNGLWPLSSYLQPPSLFCEHVTQSLCVADRGLLCWWNCACYYTHHSLFQPILLWVQWN